MYCYLCPGVNDVKTSVNVAVSYGNYEHVYPFQPLKQVTESSACTCKVDLRSKRTPTPLTVTWRLSLSHIDWF